MWTLILGACDSGFKTLSFGRWNAISPIFEPRLAKRAQQASTGKAETSKAIYKSAKK
jgi:hypothetical protein